MKPELEPLDPEVRALLDEVEPREASLAGDVRERMRLRLEMTLASTDIPAPVASAVSRAVWSRRIAALATAAAIGAAGGVAWERRAARPSEAPPPAVVDNGSAPASHPSDEAAPNLPSMLPLPSPPPLPSGPPSATGSPSAPAGPSASASKSSRDDDLSTEAHLVEVARAALVHRDFAAALSAADRHAASFPRGRLAEEREAIAIQALAGLGRSSEAAGRAEAFRRHFPESLYLPVIEATLGRR